MMMILMSDDDDIEREKNYSRVFWRLGRIQEGRREDWQPWAPVLLGNPIIPLTLLQSL